MGIYPSPQHGLSFTLEASMRDAQWVAVTDMNKILTNATLFERCLLLISIFL